MSKAGASGELKQKRKAEREAECCRLGAVARALREEQGLSQQEVADALGVHRVTIYRFEAGQHDLAMSHLRRLVEVLGSDRPEVALVLVGIGSGGLQ